MALTDNGNDLVMPVAPMYGGGGNGGFGLGGDWGSLIVLFLIAAMFGGFGGGFGMGGFGGFGGGLGIDFPWLMNGQQEIMTSTNDGFRELSTQNYLNGIQSSINELSGQVCNGFSQAEISNNARQMADMQQTFALQTAMSQGFNQLGSQFADCCCENRLANCQTQNIIQREGSETRFADANNTRDIIQSQTAGTQAVLDKLCQLELDAKNDRISELERQLTDARFNASQVAQTAEIQRGQVAEVDALYNRLATCPVGTMPVYGNQPIFTCPQQNNSCGCGCGNF